MIGPELLLQGYRLGVFPMAMEDDSIGWFSPDPRAIIPMEDFHVPHALRRALRKHFFEVKIDNAFFRQTMTNSNDKFFADPTSGVIDFIKLQDFSDRLPDGVGDFEKRKIFL